MLASTGNLPKNEGSAFRPETSLKLASYNQYFLVNIIYVIGTQGNP